MTCYGVQEPTYRSVPAYGSSAGKEAVELAAHAGLHLDPWQQQVLEDGLGEQDDGRWASFEVACVVSRQNGKSAIFEARELAGLFLFDEKLIIHTAHEYKTSQEAFRRISDLIRNTPDLLRRVKSIRVANGEQGIELKTGQRLRFLARSNGAGRGFSGDCVILDEAMLLGDNNMAALLPTMSAKPNPQLWYGASAGVGEQSVQLARVRKRGLSGMDKSLTYLEWSAELHNAGCSRECTHHDGIDDLATWAKSNPGLGYRITPEYIERERAALSRAVFSRERLGVGEYPEDVAETWLVIASATWQALIDKRPYIPGELEQLALAVDVRHDRSTSSVAVAGTRPDGRTQVELAEHRAGTGWVVDRVTELQERWGIEGVTVDPGSPAGALIADFEAAGVAVRPVTTREFAQSCGAFYDAAMNGRIRHLDEPELNAAVASVDKRPLADAWAWERRSSSTDVTPLVAASLAYYAVAAYSEGDLWVAYV
jgi:phage terminase large subunit-like protein